MSRDGRGSTGTGRAAALPNGVYQPPPAVVEVDGRLTVEFVGEDGRGGILRADRLPLPGWHGLLAAAVERRTDPAGAVRTLATAQGEWGSLGRWMHYLGGLVQPPTHPGALTVAHVEGFFAVRTTQTTYSGRDLRAIGKLLGTEPLAGHVLPQVHDALARRIGRQGNPKPGYSDGELSRLVAAARTDVAAIRNRMRAGEAQVADHQAGDADLRDAFGGGDADRLMQMAATGCVAGLVRPVRRLEYAKQLFFTRPDLLPLLVLMVAVTGCNVETIKELPAEHRILDGRAVEVRLVKRRRGTQRWWRTVTWEIGPPDRQLHTPGGLYLLAHQLTARSRQYAGGPRLWAVWRNGHKAGLRDLDEHGDPFALTLGAQIRHGRWLTRHGLHADAATVVDDDQGSPPPVLSLDFNRLKTSIDVRRTKQAGGHLPSAARTNTIPVLFRHYLRGDATVAVWAEEVIAEAVTDAEQAAVAAHQRAMRMAGGGPTVAVDAPTPASGAMDTPWSTCVDPGAHPITGQRCEVSFLDCFHCGNCLVTTEHLPRLLGLVQALTIRRTQLGEADWWARYGATWVAIGHDVLGKFTPAQLAVAGTDRQADAWLDLIENPWERP